MPRKLYKGLEGYSVVETKERKMNKCDYYLNRHPKDNEGERSACEAFNAGRCEMHDIHPNLFDGKCPYSLTTGLWDYDKANNEVD